MRVVLNADNPLDPVLERNDYSPFGSRWPTVSYPILAANRYKFNGKENLSILSESLYDYGARLHDSYLRRWMTIDPLAEQRYAWSPYAFSSGNPIVRVDPDGRADDWYQHEDEKIWRESQASTITENGKTYQNIGSTASIDNGNGTFDNYYQNVGFRSNQAFNARAHILNSGLAPSLMSTRSNLWEQGKMDLMRSTVHKGQGDFLLGAADVSSGMLQTAGDAMAVTGYALTATGVGAEFGVPLAATGNIIKNTGVGMEMAINAIDQNYQKIRYDAATNGLMYGVGEIGRFFPGPVGSTFNLFLYPFNWVLDRAGDKMIP